MRGPFVMPVFHEAGLIPEKAPFFFVNADTPPNQLGQYPTIKMAAGSGTSEIG
jgi:hypothetical protein